MYRFHDDDFLVRSWPSDEMFPARETCVPLVPQLQLLHPKKNVCTRGGGGERRRHDEGAGRPKATRRCICITNKKTKTEKEKKRKEQEGATCARPPFDHASTATAENNTMNIIKFPSFFSLSLSPSLQTKTNDCESHTRGHGER